MEHTLKGYCEKCKIFKIMLVSNFQLLMLLKFKRRGIQSLH